MWILCEWHHKWRTFRPPWPTSPGPGPKPLYGSIWLRSNKHKMNTIRENKYRKMVIELLNQFVNLLNSSLFHWSRQNSYLLYTSLFIWFVNFSPLSIPWKHFVQLIHHLQFRFWCWSGYFMWEFKQMKDLYLKMVAPRNLFLEFVHKVQSATRLPTEITQEVFAVC